MSAPLQAVSPELAIVLGMSVVMFVSYLAVSAWIYRDAKRRNSDHAVAWGVASFLSASFGGVGGLVVWPLYFVVRDETAPGGPSVGGDPE